MAKKKKGRTNPLTAAIDEMLNSLSPEQYTQLLNEIDVFLHSDSDLLDMQNDPYTNQCPDYTQGNKGCPTR